MRLLTALIVLAGLTIVPATRGRTNHDGADADNTQKDGPAEPTSPDNAAAVSASQPASPEMEQLRHLVTSQSEQLRDTREQLRQLQQRMEVLERGLHVQAGSSPEQRLAGEPPTSEPRVNANRPKSHKLRAQPRSIRCRELEPACCHATSGSDVLALGATCVCKRWALRSKQRFRSKHRPTSDNFRTAF